jgi:tetrahydromethanopterin S-methyltransferase subunit G
MSPNPASAIASAGQSAGRAVGGAVGGAGDAVGKAAARTREEAEDVWAEAKDVARKDTGRDAAVHAGLVATVALGAVELPVAAAVGAGYALFRRRRG